MITSIHMTLVNGTLRAEVEESNMTAGGQDAISRSETSITKMEEFTNFATRFNISPQSYDWGPNNEALNFFLTKFQEIAPTGDTWDFVRGFSEYLRNDFGPFIDLLDERALTRIRTKLATTPNFPDISKPFQVIKDLISLAAELGPFLPEQEKKLAIEELVNYSTLVKVFIRTPGFTLDESPSNLLHIANSMIYGKDKLLRILSPFIRARESAHTIDEVKSLIDEGRNINHESESLLNFMRDREVRVGTDKAATFFSDQAKKYFWVSMAFLIGLLILVAWLVIYINSDPRFAAWTSFSFSEAISRDLPRLSTLSLFAFGIAFLARNYRINQHQMVLNRTKAITLSAGERFIASTETEFRGQVTAVIVQSVFALGHTGFISDSGETSADNFGLLERVKTTLA